MKIVLLGVGAVFVWIVAACSASPPTNVALVPTLETATRISPRTPTITQTPSKTAEPTKTLMPRRRTQTAIRTITPPTGTPTPTRPPTNTPLPTPAAHDWDPLIENILPAPLYLLSDYEGTTQIWRVERDAKTKTLITRFGEPVWDFDVSPATGELAIASKHGVFLSDVWGGNIRRVNLKGEEPIGVTGAVNLNWSPDGTRLLFAERGVVLYRMRDGSYEQLEPPSSDYDLYYPWYPAWSPDGNYVLIQTGVPDGEIGGMIVFDPETNHKVASVFTPCGDMTWAADSQALYVSQSYYSIYRCGGPGMWRQDLRTERVIELFPISWNAELSFAIGAKEGSDGQLYYFKGSQYVEVDSIQGQEDFSVQMHRANKGALSQPTLLRNDKFKLTEVLWASDFSLAVVVDIEAIGRPDNGNIYVLTTDNKPAKMLPLRGSNVRWGKN